MEMKNKSLDILFKVQNSAFLDKRTKKSIGLKVKNVTEAVNNLELASGLRYPPYYIEPVLTVVPSSGNIVEGLGVLYARTIPIEIDTRVEIVVELSAPLVLYSTKALLRYGLAHELLHYVELVRNFSTMDLSSQITASNMFEERFTDSSRAVEPKLVFTDRKFARNLAKRTSTGLDDPKLNEKCRIKWIEKGLPVAKISMGENQKKVRVDSILRSNFDPKVKEIISKI